MSDKLKEIKNVTIGCDPEVFLINKEKNKHISAIGLFPGDKDKPHPIDDNGHGVLTDNVAVEFVIKPAKTKEELYESIKFCLDYIEDNCPKELSISDQVSVHFDSDQLQDEAACHFGCTPSFNVYTGRMSGNIDGKRTNLRSIGGHIHVGFDDATNVQREAVVKAVELFVTLPMVLMEEPNERRKLYGRAGEFRPKPYGVEARSPSSKWIMSEEYVHWVFDQVHEAIKWLNEGNTLDVLEEVKLVKAINTYDVELAKELCDTHKINVKESLLINK